MPGHVVTARFLLAGLASFDALHAQEVPIDDEDLRNTIRGAITWIAQQAIPVSGVEDAVLFPGSEGGKTPQPVVYGGSAGVLVFLENAAAVLDGEDAQLARELADKTAKGLRSCRRVDLGNRITWCWSGPGLYTGDAGIGHAFLVRHALRKDAAALATATEIGDALVGNARRKGDALRFDPQVDVILGNAGIALFVVELAQASGEKRFLDAARAAGHGLVADAVLVPSTANPERKLPTWVLTQGARSIHMPNFSHGTAGVAYALARIAAATGDEALLQAAKDGADWLLEHAVADGAGLKWIHVEGPSPVYMGGWCHGPAGTGRLFLLLESLTGEKRYGEAARKGAQFVIDYADRASKAAEGGEVEVPPNYCCGVAGVIDFFCDLYGVTRDERDAAFARKAGAYLVDVAIEDGDGRKWRNGQSVPGGPISADSRACNVDLMIGAAGEAMALLRLVVLDGEPDPIRGMPDRAVTAAKAAKQ